MPRTRTKRRCKARPRPRAEPRARRPIELPLRPLLAAMGLLVLLATVGALARTPSSVAAAKAARHAERSGTAILLSGAPVEIGTRVVLFDEPPGFDASAERCRFEDRVLPAHPASPDCNVPARIGSRPSADLASTITQLVIHYDECWTSRNCFKVLQDDRGLSVHFLLDLDGTIYQTCDLAARARHARSANDRSVGVEIAHPGALEDRRGLADHYVHDGAGVLLELPRELRTLATPGFVPRPARAEPIRGRIHGRLLTQYDFTDAQYEALAHLAAGLSRALPRIRLEAPRGRDGRVRSGTFDTPEEAAAFHGILGHYHLQTDKFDPGPAFDWERVLARAREIQMP